jgi:hypothetical protein
MTSDEAVHRARQCVAVAEDSVARQELTITRCLISGDISRDLESSLVDMNARLDVFRERLRYVESSR